MITLSKECFKRAVSLVAFSASKDLTKYVLLGVQVSVENNVLELASTDGHRLSVYRLPYAGPDFSALIDAKALSKVSTGLTKAKSLYGKSPYDIDLSVDRELAIFRYGEIAASSRLISGQYPNYRQLIPESLKHKAQVETAVLLDALLTQDVIEPELDQDLDVKPNKPVASTYVDLRFHSDLTQVVLYPDKDSPIFIPLPLGTVIDTAKTIRVRFNRQYLVDCLKVMVKNKMTVCNIGFNGPTNPMVLSSYQYSVGNGQTSYEYLVMPIYVRD